jgi:hypothetical protein
MTPNDKSAIQQNIEFIRQMSDEDARMGLVSCKTSRDLTVDRIRILESKLANRAYYRGRTADHQTLRAETLQLARQNQLIAIYESRLQQAQPEKTQSAEPETALSIDKSVLRGKWVDEMYEQGRIVLAMLQAHYSPEEVRVKCPRFCSEVLDWLNKKQQTEFYDKHDCTADELLGLIGQVHGLSGHTVKKDRTKFRNSRKKPEKQ